MHYFYIFGNQVKKLPLDQMERISFLKEAIRNAVNLFKKIEESDVLLDGNSDGSHLTTWYNVLSSFQKELGK